MTRTLVLVRHGQSEWNLQNLFTGWKDPDLTEKGVEEARTAGRRLKDYGLHVGTAFTSELFRAQRTLSLLLEELGQPHIPTIRDVALNERDYGDLSGLNKDDARAKWGEEQVHIWRRSYDIPPPAMDEERAFFDAIGRTQGYAVDEHGLTLTLSDGGVMRFRELID